ncbi:MAG: EF-hand domain-containing protein [archaeon]|nr:EF-hand domain-containing protein [archaeon]
MKTNREKESFCVTIVCTFHLATTNEALIKNAFDEADLDKSGAIDNKELKKVLKTCYLRTAEDPSMMEDPEFKESFKQIVDMTIEQYDTNKDGQIQFAEYKELYANLMGQILMKQMDMQGITKEKAIDLLTPLKTTILDHFTTKKIGIKDLSLFKSLNTFLALANK